MLYLVNYDKREVLLKDSQQVLEIIEQNDNVNIQRFRNPDEAIQAFYPKQSMDKHQLSKIQPISYTHNKVIQNMEVKEAVAYTDGSWNPQINSFGVGIVVFYKKKRQIKTQNLSSSRHFNGDAQGAFLSEVFAVFKAIKWCYENHRNKVTIFCDNEQVLNRKADLYKIIQKEFNEKVKPYKKVSLKLQKIAAHHNNEYNEQAHRLANEARKSIN